MALVAQLGELWAEDLKVLGSIPGLGMKPNKSPGCLANTRNQILSKKLWFIMIKQAEGIAIGLITSNWRL